jgi:putative phosphoribosyl transferase
MMETEAIRHLFRVLPATPQDSVQEVVLSADSYTIRGTLRWSGTPRGVIVFANGSGNSLHSPRNRFVSSVFTEAGFATVLLDLLSEREAADRWKAFDLDQLANRLAFAVKWVMSEPILVGLPVGVFGASMASAAALIAAATQPNWISAIVSRGGRPDLAWNQLPAVQAPTLLIVGEADESVLGWNQDALSELSCPKELAVVPGATHLFEEPGALEQVARLARMWFEQHLSTRVTCAGGAATRC